MVRSKRIPFQRRTVAGSIEALGGRSLRRVAVPPATPSSSVWRLPGGAEKGQGGLSVSRATDKRPPAGPSNSHFFDADIICTMGKRWRWSSAMRGSPLARRAMWIRWRSLNGRARSASFREKESGARGDRPQLAKAIASLDEGDVLPVTRLDRLGQASAQHARPAQHRACHRRARRGV